MIKMCVVIEMLSLSNIWVLLQTLPSITSPGILEGKQGECYYAPIRDDKTEAHHALPKVKSSLNSNPAPFPLQFICHNT